MKSGSVLEQLNGQPESQIFAEIPQEFVFKNATPDIDWPEVYNILGMEAEYVEFTKANPPRVDPNLWIIPVIKGVTCNKVISALRQLNMDVHIYVNDLDKAVTANDRDSTRDGSYVVLFRRTIEADEENKNLSANKLKKREHMGITLVERLLLELGYFLRTGNNLDIKNSTYCTGSRVNNSYVPFVYRDFDSRKIYVYWCFTDSFNDELRSRSVISSVDEVKPSQV